MQWKLNEVPEILRKSTRVFTAVKGPRCVSPPQGDSEVFQEENEMLPLAVCRGDGGHSVLPVASALMKVFVYVPLLG